MGKNQVLTWFQSIDFDQIVIRYTIEGVMRLDKQWIMIGYDISKTLLLLIV